MAQFAIDEVLTTGIQISGFIFDYSSSLGTPGQVLACTSSGVMWQADSSNADLASLSGQIAATGTLLNNRINSLSGYSNATFATITNLAATGSVLDAKINTLSGYSNANFATITNLAATGSVLDTKINTLSGYSNATFATITNLAATGSTLDTKINTTNTNLAATGSTLDTKINTLSGYSNQTFLSGSGTQYYVPRWNTSKELVTGSIYDNGNVGIGTTSVGSPLEVYGTSMDPSLTPSSASIFNVNSLGVELAVGRMVTSPFSVWLQGKHATVGGDLSYPIVLNPLGGPVGIGLTNPEATSRLHIKNLAAASKVTIESANNSESLINFSAQSSEYSIGFVRDGSNVNSFRFCAADSLSAGEVMRLQDGKVGIGTTSPSTKLHLYEADAADVTLRLTAANGYDPVFQMCGQDNNITSEGFEIWYDNAIGDVHLSTTYAADAASIHFHTRVGASKSTSNERLTILGNGRVGIGTASPTTLLSVGGAGSTSAASGITFGGDAQTNIYRFVEDTLRTDGAFITTSYLRSLSYIQLLTNLYPDSFTDTLNINIGNTAANNWETAIKIKPGSYVGIGTTNPTGKLHIVSSVAGETVLRADGTNGILFSVNDDLSDSLMSVNNSAGLPVLEVFADDRVVMGQYGQNDFVLINNKVGIGTASPTTLLSVGGAGSTLAASGLTFGGDAVANLYRISSSRIKTDGSLEVAIGIISPTITSLSGNIAATGSTLDAKINTLSGYSNNSFATILNLAATGSVLDTKINTLSGYSNANFATILNLAATGSTLDTKINTTNTNLAATGSTLDTKINTTNTNLAATGSTLDTKINTTNTNLAATGSTLDTKINATNTNLAATGSTLDTKINTTNTNLAATGSTLNARINSLSGYAGSTFLSGQGVANWTARWNGAKELITGSIYDLGTGIGIGTTSPSTILTIAKAIDAAAYGSGTRAIDFKIYYPGFDTNTVKASIYAGVSAQGTLETTKGYLAFLTSATAGTQNLTEKLRIEADGNVGIGTTSPAELLDIAASADNSAVAGPKVNFKKGATTKAVIGIGGNYLGQATQTDDLIFRNDAGNILFGFAGAEKMRIASNGNVGIATTLPGYSLQIGQNTSGNNTDYSLGILRHGTLSFPSSWTSNPAFKIIDLVDGGPSNVDINGIINLELPRFQASDTNSEKASLFTITYDSALGPLRVDGKGNTWIGYDRTATGINTSTFSSLIYGGLAVGSNYQTTTLSNGQAIFEGNVGVGSTNPAYKLDVTNSITSRSAFNSPRFSSAGTYVYGVTNSPTWVIGNGSSTNNNATAPDGTTSAGTYTLSATSALLFDLYLTISGLTNGRVYTVGMWVKLGTATNFCLVVNNTQNWNTIGGKAFTSSDGLSTSKWTHISYTFAATATGAINLHLGYNLETGVTQQTAGTVFLWNIEMTEFSSTWIGNVEDEIRLPGSSIWTSRGSVGIGTTVPANKLTVTTSTQYDGYYLRNTNGVVGTMLGVSATNDDGTVGLYSNTILKTNITANGVSYFNGGNVGIGVASPSTLLGVGGAGSTSAASGITFGGDAVVNLYRLSDSVLKTDAAFTAASLASSSYVYAASYLQTAGGQIYAGAPYGALTVFVGNIAQNAWEAGLFIGRGSYVGIGTTNPTGKLHVVSSVAGETVLRADGTNGTLFSIVDDLSDSLMSVNNSAGLPVLEVFADDRVVAGQYGSGDFVLINNKIGVGTSNPANKLSVIGAASIGSNSYNVSAPANGLIVEGSVGIGTTSAATYSSKIAVETSLTRGLMVFNPALANAGTLYGLGFGYAMSNYDSAYISFYKVGVGDTSNRLSFSLWNKDDILNINGAGNVGIGVTTPAYKLDVFGSSSADVGRFYNNATSCNFYVGSTNNTAATDIILYTSNGNAQFFKNRSNTSWGGADSLNIYTSNGAIAFHPAGETNAVYFANNGRVGINTTSPTSKLHVVETTPTGSRIQLGSISTSALMNANLVNDFLILTAPFNAVPASVSNNNAKWGIKMGGGSVDAPDALGKSACIYAVSEEDAVGGLGYNRKVGLALHTSPFDLPSVERFRITNIGDVGIGVTNPSNKLQISGGGISFTTSTGLAVPMIGIVLPTNIAFIGPYNSPADGNSPTVVALNHARSVQQTWFYASGNIAMVLNKEGRLHIGNNNNAPNCLLSVGPSSSTTAVSGMCFGNDASANLYRSAASTIKTDGSLSVIGSVKIGSDYNSSRLLQVKDGLVIGSSFYTFASIDVSTTGDLILTANANPANLGANTNIIFKHGTSAGGGPLERMRIVGDGNVGIGETSPLQKLHVLGNTVFGNFGSNTYKYNLYLSFDAVADESWVRIYLPQNYVSDNNGGTVKVRVLFAASHASFGAHQEYQISYKTFYPSPFLTFSKIICTNKTSDFGGGSYYGASSTPDVIFYSNADDYLYIKIKGFSATYNRVRFIEAEVFGRTAATPTITTTTAPASSTELVKTIQFLPQEGKIFTAGSVGIGTTNTDPLSLSRDINLAIVTTATNAALTLVGGGAGRIDFGVGATRTAGIYSDSSNYTEIFTSTALPLVFSTNSVAKMRIASNGNVGIGTDNPTAKLVVMGDDVQNYAKSSVPTAIIADDDVEFLIGTTDNIDGEEITLRMGSVLNTYYDKGAYIKAIQGANVDRFKLAFGTSDGAAATTKMSIDNVGNVGIGITNPGDKFQVNLNSGENILANIRSNGVSANNKVSFRLSELGTAAAEFSLVRDGTSYQAKLQTVNNQPLSFGTNSVTRMVIDIAGNVGIGTAVPTAQTNYKVLQVNGTTAAIIEAMVNNVRIGGIDSDSSSLYFGSIGSFPIVFRTAVVEKMRITAAGLVGIGTATPTTLLSVGGAGSTLPASGITFGGDAVTNLYRVGADILKTDANLQIVRSLELRDVFYHYSNIRFLNKAGSNWLTWFTRDTSESEAVSRLDYIRSINTTSGGNLGIGTNTPSGKLHVVSTVAGATVLRTDGTNGTLFSVVDDLSDSLMSVNNSAGLPVLEVFADDRVVAGQYGSGDFVLINNKVGLGTSNPANKLAVIGGASIGSTTYNTSAPSNGLIVEGRVGIGSTNPNYNLDVYSPALDAGRFYNNQTACQLSLGSTANTDYVNLIWYTSNGNAQFFRNRSSASWGGTDSMNLYNSNGGFGFHANGVANSVIITTAGDVGINKAAPTTKLDVVGSFRVVGTTNVGGIFVTGTSASQGNIRPAVNNGTVLISDDSGSSTRGLTVSNGGGAIISSVDANYDMLTLQIGGTTNHSFNKDGNVGIGATNPNSARLHIKGNGSVPVIRVETALIESPAGGTAGRTLKGWLPIMTGAAGTDKVYIPLFGPLN
mgnify:CR=1 FL=1